MRKSPKQAREGRLAQTAIDPTFIDQKIRELEQKTGRKVKKRALPQAPSELFPGADPENYPYRLAQGKKSGGAYG